MHLSASSFAYKTIKGHNQRQKKMRKFGESARLWVTMYGQVEQSDWIALSTA